MANKKPRRGLQHIFPIGEQVACVVGNRKYRGTVIEDRGKIATNGRRLYRIEVKAEPGFVTELPADELPTA